MSKPPKNWGPVQAAFAEMILFGPRARPKQQKRGRGRPPISPVQYRWLAHHWEAFRELPENRGLLLPRILTKFLSTYGAEMRRRKIRIKAHRALLNVLGPAAKESRRLREPIEALRNERRIALSNSEDRERQERAWWIARNFRPKRVGLGGKTAKFTPWGNPWLDPRRSRDAWLYGEFGGFRHLRKSQK